MKCPKTPRPLEILGGVPLLNPPVVQALCYDVTASIVMSPVVTHHNQYYAVSNCFHRNRSYPMLLFDHSQVLLYYYWYFFTYNENRKCKRWKELCLEKKTKKIPQGSETGSEMHVPWKGQNRGFQGGCTTEWCQELVSVNSIALWSKLCSLRGA